MNIVEKVKRWEAEKKTGEKVSQEEKTENAKRNTPVVEMPAIHTDLFQKMKSEFPLIDPNTIQKLMLKSEYKESFCRMEIEFFLKFNGDQLREKMNNPQPVEKTTQPKERIQSYIPRPQKQHTDQRRNPYPQVYRIADDRMPKHQAQRQEQFKEIKKSPSSVYVKKEAQTRIENEPIAVLPEKIEPQKLTDLTHGKVQEEAEVQAGSFPAPSQRPVNVASKKKIELKRDWEEGPIESSEYTKKPKVELEEKKWESEEERLRNGGEDLLEKTLKVMSKQIEDQKLKISELEKKIAQFESESESKKQVGRIFCLVPLESVQNLFQGLPSC